MAPRKTGLDAEIRDLYRGPLDQFTPARNALAARLKKEKRADDAAEVKALPKPTPSAWGVNLLFEQEPEKMKELLAAGRKARTAQREAVSGRGLESLRETIRDARRLADELRWDAARILSEQGRSPSRDVVERIAANLQALAFSPSAEEEASRGWLDRDLDPPGFEVLAGLTAGAPVVNLEARRKEREEKKKPAPSHPKKEAKEEEERRKREAAEEAQREREAERVRRRVAVAEEKVERARAEADPLREETEQAEKAVAEARRRLEEAERAAARVRERYERAAERLAHAEAALREAKDS